MSGGVYHAAVKPGILGAAPFRADARYARRNAVASICRYGFSLACVRQRTDDKGGAEDRARVDDD